MFQIKIWFISIELDVQQEQEQKDVQSHWYHIHQLQIGNLLKNKSNQI